jgi:hypothetical protein
VNSVHPTQLLASIPNFVSHASENFQGGLNFLSGGLSLPQPTPGAATRQMTDPCKIPQCTRPSFALCNCCEKQICKFHINEHSELLLAQLTPLVDKIDALNNELQSFDINQTNIDSRVKLEHWRTEYHRKIDLFYEKKCEELDQCIVKKTLKKTGKNRAFTFKDRSF